MYSVVSLFSGAGGLDIGLEKTRHFVTLACMEKVSTFCDTLRVNRDVGKFINPELRVFEGDISKLDPHEVMRACGLEPGQLDLLSGGPPCQTFSTAGKRGTVQDPRGMLLWDFMRFVVAFRPKFFVMENVRGLLSAAIKHRQIKDRPDEGGQPLDIEEESGSVVALWLADLAKNTGNEYRVDCFEVNAVNYGAPQLRERVIFIGNRLNHVVDFPEPTHGGVQKLKKSAQLSLFGQNVLLPFATLGEALDTVQQDNGEVMDFSPRKKQYLDMVPEGSNWRALPVDVQQRSMGKAWYAKGGRSGWWRRLTSDLPCPTVVTMPNHASTAMCHPKDTRALTVKECAAVQQFPPDWQFCGTTAEKYTQIGNALPVRLAQVVGEVISSHLDHAKDKNFIAESAPAYRRIYLHSHVRTRQWYKDGVVYKWTDGEDNSHAKYSAKQRPTIAMGGQRRNGKSSERHAIQDIEIRSSEV